MEKEQQQIKQQSKHLLNNPRMNKDHEDIWYQAYLFICKYIVLIWGIILGLVGKFSYDLINNKKFTRYYLIGTTGLAIVGGYLSGIWVYENCPTKAPLFIPIATMLSNNIVSALMVIDYKALINKDWRGAFDILIKPKDKDVN